jgi:hypothetical protein
VWCDDKVSLSITLQISFHLSTYFLQYVYTHQQTHLFRLFSRRLLRLFTVGGIQGPIIWLPGEPVTIVGRDRFMAVIYHRSMSPMQDGTQLLGYSIIDGVNGTTVATGDVSALSPGASLTWAGFTESCALTVMDSDGMLSLLARPNNELSSFGNWVPFLDTVGLKKSISDNFWPVEVNGGRLVCVLLRGGKEHPDAARRPVTTTLKLRMPMATCLSMKSGVEEEASVRANIALDQRKIYDDVLVSEGKMDSEDIEEEYDRPSGPRSEWSATCNFGVPEVPYPYRW